MKEKVQKTNEDGVGIYMCDRCGKEFLYGNRCPSGKHNFVSFSPVMVVEK